MRALGLGAGCFLAACITVQQAPKGLPTPDFSSSPFTAVRAAPPTASPASSVPAPAPTAQAVWTPPPILFASPSPTPAPKEGSVITPIPTPFPTPVLTTSFIQIQPGVRKLIRPLSVVGKYGFDSSVPKPCNIALDQATQKLVVELAPLDRRYFNTSECPQGECRDDFLVASFALDLVPQTWAFLKSGQGSRRFDVGLGSYVVRFYPIARNDFFTSVNSNRHRNVVYDATKRFLVFGETEAATLSVGPEVGVVAFPPQHDAVNHLTTSAILGREIAYVTVSVGDKFSLIWADTSEQFWHTTPLDFASWQSPQVAYPELVFLQGSTPGTDQLAILDWHDPYDCSYNELYLVDTSWISSHAVLAVTLAQQLIALGGAPPLF